MLQDVAGCLAYGLGCSMLHSGVVPLTREGAKTSSRFFQIFDLKSVSRIPLKKESEGNIMWDTGPIQVTYNSCFASGHFQLKYQPLPSYI